MSYCNQYIKIPTWHFSEYLIPLIPDKFLYPVIYSPVYLAVQYTDKSIYHPRDNHLQKISQCISHLYISKPMARRPYFHVALFPVHILFLHYNPVHNKYSYPTINIPRIFIPYNFFHFYRFDNTGRHSRNTEHDCKFFSLIIQWISLILLPIYMIRYYKVNVFYIKWHFFVIFGQIKHFIRSFSSYISTIYALNTLAISIHSDAFWFLPWMTADI